MRQRNLVAGLFGTLLLASCGAPPPPPPPPTVVNLTLITTADNNPTTENAGAPLAVRVYQLGSAANFSGAEFFPLFNDDATVLKSDLIARENFLLPPGTTKTETIMPKDMVKSIGVFGAYRDFQHSAWHVTADVEAHKVNTITVTAGRAGVTIKAEVTAPK